MKVTFAQIFLIGIAMLMGFLAESPWPGIVGVGLLGTCLIATPVASGNHRRWALIGAGLVTPFALAILPMTPGRIDALDPYHTVLAWLIGVGVSLSLVCTRDLAARRGIKIHATVWAFYGAFAWIAGAYWQDRSIEFFAGLALLLSLLIALKYVFRIPPSAFKSSTWAFCW